MRTPLMILALTALLAACTAKTPDGDSASSTGEAGAGGSLALPFIADDYAAALAEARERDLPIFVETWAPW